MNGGDLYKLATNLGHSNIKMAERYAQLDLQHLAKTGNVSFQISKMLNRLLFLNEGAEPRFALFRICMLFDEATRTYWNARLVLRQ